MHNIYGMCLSYFYAGDAQSKGFRDQHSPLLQPGLPSVASALGSSHRTLCSCLRVLSSGAPVGPAHSPQDSN